MANAPVSRDTISTLVRNATFAADTVAMDPHPTQASRTRAIVERTIEFLISNRLIEVNPVDQWKEWLTMDPPYDATRLELKE